MRFDKLIIRNVGPFQSADIDLTALPGKLTAVVGANGAGKTTLLELLAGGLFRECPTRGTLASLATARDGMVEVTVTNGARHTVRQLVDHLSGKGETLITDAAGEPVLENAKVSAADKWIAQHLPTPTALYNSSFAVQGRRGFLDLGKGERKALLVQLLDLQRFERMADDARERATVAKSDLAVLRAKLADLEAPNLEALKAAELFAESSAKLAQSALDQAQLGLERARAAAGDAARALELAEQRRAAEARRAAAVKQVSEIETRLANNREVLARGDEIRAAQARALELNERLAGAKEAVASAQARLDMCNGRAEAASTALGYAQTESQRARVRATQAGTRLKDRDAVAKAVAELGSLRELEAKISGEQEAARAEIARLSELLLKGKDHRIGVLRAGLEGIADQRPIVGHEEALPHQEARMTLQTDEAVASAASEAPARLNDAKNAEDLARNHLLALRKKLADAERLAARAEEMETAQRDQDAALAEHATAAAKLPALEAALADARSLAAAATREVDDAAKVPATIAAELATLAPLLAQARRLEEAAARIEELNASLEPLRTTLATADAELAALPVIDVEAVDLSVFEREVAHRQSEQSAKQAAHTRAQDASFRSMDVYVKRTALADQITELESKLADWTRLAQDLGRDGLQALELDAALPEINTIANSLLHRCLGTRFTVELKTSRLSADGKKTIEDLEVRVLDTVNGRDADADTYSGGELVLVGSAISLALTTLACRRANSEAPTIVLDEAGAALDAANGRAWIAMLRLAVDEIGASRCLFISHSEELQQLADSQIRIADGKVVVS